jgi:hypothetical protein
VLLCVSGTTVGYCTLFSALFLLILAIVLLSVIKPLQQALGQLIIQAIRLSPSPGFLYPIILPLVAYQVFQAINVNKYNQLRSVAWFTLFDYSFLVGACDSFQALLLAILFGLTRACALGCRSSTSLSALSSSSSARSSLSARCL